MMTREGLKMKRFKVGEVAVIIEAAGGMNEFIGRECTIIFLDPEDDEDYALEVNGLNPADYGDYNYFVCEDFCLKKKPPEEKIDWVKLCKLDKVVIKATELTD